jgi:hypothetical protein
MSSAREIASPVSLWQAFLGGLLRPSRLALSSSLLVCAAGFAGLALLITPERFVRHHGYFAEATSDSDVFLSAQALELARSRPAELGPSVVLIGGSSLMAAVSYQDLVERLARDGRRCIPLWSLGQSVLDSLTVADAVPPGLDGVAVFAVSMLEMARGVIDDPERVLSEARLAFDSPTREGLLEAAGVEPERHTGVFFWDHRRFFLPRLRPLFWNALVSGPVERRWDPWTGAPTDDEKLRLVGRRVRRATDQGLMAHREECLAAYAAVGRRLREGGSLRVALLETPLSPTVVEEYLGAEVLAEHRERMRAFAAENGFEFWSLGDEAGLESGDFKDHTHLSSARARQRFTELLAERALAAAPASWHEVER